MQASAFSICSIVNFQQFVKVWSAGGRPPFLLFFPQNRFLFLRAYVILKNCTTHYFKQKRKGKTTTMNANDIWLIAGLGNPEAKYDGTRHNAGFAALDSLAGKWGISVSKTKFQGLWGQGEVDGHKVVLLKPLTYMNLSGDSITPLAGFFKIPADHVIVLCDDITQAPGKLRIRPSGSAGGHNGLKSIIARLGGENFPRIRIGVGAKPRPDYDLADWVLGKFPPEDAKAMADRYPDLEAAAKLIMDGKLGLAQSKYNG